MRPKLINRLPKSKYLIITMLIICSSMILIGTYINFKFYDRQIIRVDGIGYYAYLPGLFIDHDLSFSNLNCDYILLENGKILNKYPIGVSICQSPFFLALYIATVISGKDVTGWEIEFQFIILISSCFYYVLGSIFNYQTLRKYFSEKTALLSIIFLTFGTRLFHYASVDASLSHIYSYAGFSIWIYLIITATGKNVISLKYICLLGGITGLLINIRNTNVIMILFALPFVFEYLRQHDMALNDILKKLCIYMLSTFTILFPQAYYWHYVTGYWLIYSYNGERFDWFHPHIAGVLLGNNTLTGILRGAPILAIAVIGGYAYINHYLNNSWKTSITFCLILNLYITSTWWCWDSLSRRTYIDYLPLELILYSCLLEYFSSTRKKYFRLLITICFLLIIWSLYKMYQYWTYWV